MGAFLPCFDCGAVPETEDDLAVSLVLTERYFDSADLKDISATMRSGGPRPRLQPKQHKAIVEMIRRMQADADTESS